MITIHRFLTTLSIFLPLAACTSPRGDTGASAPERSVDPRPELAPSEPVTNEPLKPAAWTDHFVTPAVLVADRIRVEGPAGLLEHLALRSDDALFERTVKTVPEGFLQTVRPRVLPDGGLEIVRGQLDAWQLAATGEIVALERPGDVPVVVEAVGDASWRDTNGEEQRGPRLTFQAEVEQEREAPSEVAER